MNAKHTEAIYELLIYLNLFQQKYDLKNEEVITALQCTGLILSVGVSGFLTALDEFKVVEKESGLDQQLDSDTVDELGFAFLEENEIEGEDREDYLFIEDLHSFVEPLSRQDEDGCVVFLN